MSIVIENLKEAIIGESNAKRKYELFAEQAKKENLGEISHLFNAVAFAESIHIKNHVKALSTILSNPINPEDFVVINEDELKSKVKDTRSNLIDAINGETYEFKKMYKNFIKNARKNGEDVAELSIDLARKAENVHRKLYSRFLKKLEKNQSVEPLEIYICSICGNVELNNIPNVCPICDHSQKYFITK
ncbi:MAG: rubrerythrin family protein [Promethearchaeota archaeon]